MALTSSEIAALNPADPADAEVCQEEAIYWADAYTALSATATETGVQRHRLRMQTANLANASRLAAARAGLQRRRP